jgi:hypothetical protein
MLAAASNVFLPPCTQLVELKTGETYNGHMVLCDTWMNLHLREVIYCSRVRCSADRACAMQAAAAAAAAY